MKQDDPNLEKLLDAYFEGGLDETERYDLESLLRSSAAARGEFWQRAGLESALEGWAEGGRGESLAFPATAAAPGRGRGGWKRRLPLVSGWAAAAVLLAAWMLQTQNRDAGETAAQPSAVEAIGPATATPALAPSQAAPVAYLSRASAVSADEAMLPGRLFSAGREVRIAAGTLELDFFSGARVAIQGPAVFTPVSDMRVAVSQGTVQVHVPDSAKNFVIELPDGTITDFGTTFDVKVGDGRTERVQVSEGEVELSGTRDGSEPLRILEGQAVTIGQAGISQPIGFKKVAVMGALDEVETEERKRAIAGWEALCEEMASDPSLLVHFRFLAEEEESREIPNHARAAGAPQSGTVIAAEWSRGRWPGKPALAFRNQASRVRVDVPGEFPQATLLAWVRVDGLPRRYNGIFLSEFGIPGETHWQMSADGRFWFGVRPREVRHDWSFHRAFSEPVLSPYDFGPWHLLATTYDADSREVIHFIDGVEAHRSALDDSVPLRFGRATLGNFFDPTPARHADAPGLGEEWSFRNWTGSIDEFALFSRPLSSGEILRIHEAGRPR